MQSDGKGVLKDSCIFFHTPSNIARSVFFHMVCAGEYFCNNEYRVERETYHSYLIMYVVKGSGFVIFNDRTFQVHTDDVVFLDCHKPHGYYTDKGWETLWLHFDGNSSKEFFDLVYGHSGVVIPMKESPVVRRYISMILDDLKHNRVLNEVLISCHIQRMLAEILLLSAGIGDYGMEGVSPVIDAVTYIHSNYRTKINIGDLAAYVKVSPFHFSRIFKKETGYSPYEYIIKTRIDHAKTLLRQTRLSIKQIAYEVGFESESNFVNIFRQKVCLTPNDFRNTPL